MCVQNCIGKIRIMGFINPPWKAQADNPIDYLVHKKKLALPYYPQLGLEPNIYYIPPVHADLNYLRQMFGPRVEESIEAYHQLKNDPVAQGLLVLMGSSDQIMHKFKVQGNQALAYNQQGEVIIQVPITEPLVVRDSFDSKLGAARHNTP